jgi:superfamily I DNA/RNA helicase
MWVSPRDQKPICCERHLKKKARPRFTPTTEGYVGIQITKLMAPRYCFKTTGFQKAQAKLKAEERKGVDKALENHKAGISFGGTQPEPLNAKPWWSIKAGRNIRLIFERVGNVDVFFYVDHHDEAYAWAESHHFQKDRELIAIDERHVTTTVDEVVRIKRTLLFADYSREYLLSLGVPAAILEDLRNSCTKENFDDFIEHMPGAVWEKLDCLQEGKPVVDADQPRHCLVYLARTDPDLRDALDRPFQSWAAYLHPEQKHVITSSYRGGSARVFGSAGTGKSVTVVHRAARLADNNPGTRILVTAYNTHTSAKLAADLDLLLGPDSDIRARIDVRNLHKIAWQIGQDTLKITPSIFKERDLIGVFANALRDFPERDKLPPFCTSDFLAKEWIDVIDDCEIRDWDTYRTVSRVGRRTALSETARRVVWNLFERVSGTALLPPRMTFGRLLAACTDVLNQKTIKPYDHVLVDEAQLLGMLELRFVRSLVVSGPDDLFFALDGNQRLFRRSRPWSDAGIEVANRSFQLKLNYRTTRQIAAFAERFLNELTDTPAHEPSSYSYMAGPEPQIRPCSSVQDEIQEVARILRDLWRRGIEPREIAIFARTENILHERAEAALASVGMRSRRGIDTATANAVALTTIQLSIGLEFRAVIVLGCEAESMDTMTEAEQDLDETELLHRRMSALYVACTRAREMLFLTSAGPMKELIVRAMNQVCPSERAMSNSAETAAC